MKILLSPAKKMNVNTDDLAPEGLPVFMEQTLWGGEEAVGLQRQDRRAEL